MGRVGGAFAWSFAEQIASKVVSLLVQIVLARMLLPEDFGVLAVMAVFVNLADTVAQGGFGQAVVQCGEEDDATLSTAFWLSEGLALALYALIFLAAPAIASFYGNGGIAAYLRAMALYLPFGSANSVQRAVLQRRMDFRALFAASLSSVLLAGAVGVGCALSGLGVWALVAQTVCAGVFACAAMAVQLRWLPRFAFDAARARTLFGFGWKMSASGVLNTAAQSVSELIIGKACTASDLGYYSQGRKYPLAVVGAVSNSLCNVLFPAFAELRHSRERLCAALLRGLRLGSAAFVPLAVLLAVAAEPLVSLLLTDRWLPCVPVFRLACLSYAVLMFQVVNLRAYMALGRSDVYLAVHVVKVLVNVPVTAAVAALTGDVYLVAAAVAAVNVATILFVDVAPAGRVVGVSALEQARAIAPVYLAAALAAVPALALSLLPLGDVSLLALQVSAYAAAYLILSRVMGVGEVLEVLGLVRSKLKR